MIKSIKKILIYKFDLINFFRTFESLDYKLSCYLNCYHAFNNQFFWRNFPTLRCQTHYNTRFEMIVILNDSYQVHIYAHVLKPTIIQSTNGQVIIRISLLSLSLSLILPEFIYHIALVNLWSSNYSSQLQKFWYCNFWWSA